MPNNRVKSNYCKAVVVVHGKSERLIVQHIKSSLHLPMEIYSNRRGKNNIQITSLYKELTNTIFKDKTSLLRQYEIETRGKELVNFKLFIIMDTDDCTVEVRENYINRDMFKKHWLYNHIVTIYNNPKLEIAVKDAGIEHRVIKDSEKAETYIKLFPNISSKTVQKTDIEQLKEMSDKFREIKSSNMNEIIDYCLGQAKKIQPTP